MVTNSVEKAQPTFEDITCQMVFLTKILEILRQPAPLQTLLQEIADVYCTYLKADKVFIFGAITGDNAEHAKAVVSPRSSMRPQTYAYLPHYTNFFLRDLVQEEIEQNEAFEEVAPIDSFVKSIEPKVRSFCWIPIIAPALGRLGIIVLVSKKPREQTWEMAKSMILHATESLAHVAYEESMFNHLVDALAQSLDERDTYTAGHSMVVGTLAERIADKLGMPPEECRLLRIAGRLHDIGKIGIPESILSKRGALTDSEMAMIQAHPELGAKILARVPELGIIAKWAELHHERLNGSGYPFGLSGNQLTRPVRILGVADSFHAMISDRPYRKAEEKRIAALAELVRCSDHPTFGIHERREYSWEIVEALIDIEAGNIPELKGCIPTDYLKRIEEYLSISDGLFTPQYFNAFLHEQANRSLENQQPLTLCFFRAMKNEIALTLNDVSYRWLAEKIKRAVYKSGEVGWYDNYTLAIALPCANQLESACTLQRIKDIERAMQQECQRHAGLHPLGQEKRIEQLVMYRGVAYKEPRELREINKLNTSSGILATMLSKRLIEDAEQAIGAALTDEICMWRFWIHISDEECDA